MCASVHSYSNFFQSWHTGSVAVGSRRFCDLVVHLGIWVGGLQLVAGGEHGQARLHAVHVEAVGRAGAGARARLGQLAAALTSLGQRIAQRHFVRQASRRTAEATWSTPRQVG